MQKISGIYRIDCCGKCVYVGQSINLNSRESSHRRKLRNNNHYNIYLQRTYNKYNGNFIFSMVESCSPEKLTERENYWIEKLNPKCNLQIPVDSTHFTVTDEVRNKMSKISKDRMTPEMRELISKKTKQAMSIPEIRKRFIDGQNNKKNKTPWNKGLKGICHPPNTKKVYCLELQKVFNSAYETGIYLGAKDGKSISRVCLGQRKTYKGMHFKYIDE